MTTPIITTTSTSTNNNPANSNAATTSITNNVGCRGGDDGTTTDDASSDGCVNNGWDTSGGAIVVVAKCPIPNKSKTRLIPMLGVHGATSLAKAMLCDVLVTLSKCVSRNIIFFTSIFLLVSFFLLSSWMDCHFFSK